MREKIFQEFLETKFEKSYIDVYSKKNPSFDNSNLNLQHPKVDKIMSKTSFSLPIYSSSLLEKAWFCSRGNIPGNEL